MKVSRSTRIDLQPETVWEEVQTPKLLRHIAWPLVQFVPVEGAMPDKFRDGGRYPMSLRIFGFIPFGTQWIVTSLDKSGDDQWPKQLRDNGYSGLIKTWDHWIMIEPDGKGGTRYSDAVEVSAGILTPFIWAFSQLFYWHRQRRWRGLARSLAVRRVIDTEMAAYRAAVASGSDELAWHHLERAHIVAQLFLGPHIASHMAMLRFANKQRDGREIIGQLFRLVLAPIGSLTGRLPIGNPGRSNVSAFAHMPIPADLKAAVTQQKL